jgi:hypothetical protein
MLKHHLRTKHHPCEISSQPVSAEPTDAAELAGCLRAIADGDYQARPSGQGPLAEAIATKQRVPGFLSLAGEKDRCYPLLRRHEEEDYPLLPG